MYHLPAHPQIEDIIQKHQKQFPELLSNEQDRLLLKRAFCIHRYISQKNHAGYSNYIQQLPLEEQSLTIQTYKKLLIGSMTHPNQRSCYFPYLPAEKTADPYADEERENYTDFPLYTKYTQALFDAPSAITAPRNALQELFHDLLFLSSMANQIALPATFEQLITYW